DVHILDGGIAAWVKDGRKTDPQASEPPKEPGAFEIKADPKLRADWKTVDTARKAKNEKVLDVRTAEEWNGATPYMEWRGGHVPGAEHFEWNALIQEDGRILPKAKVVEAMKGLGIGEKTPVIAYCTGGVRAAFVQAVLIHY